MYQSERVNECTVMITDFAKEALYLIEGEREALLIDSGMDTENLREYAETLTDKEIHLALTHGHIDHIGRTGDFERVYMDMADRAVYEYHTNERLGEEARAKLSFKPVGELLDMPEQFDLGGLIIRVVPLPGHTPGTVLFVDTAHQTVFTGDAIGSGSACWMQLAEGLCLSQYKASLLKTREELLALGVDYTWTFLGGHAGQEYTSKVSSYNRLDLQLLEDIIVLCDKAVAGDVVLEDTDALQRGGKPYYISYKKAELIVTKEKMV